MEDKIIFADEKQDNKINYLEEDDIDLMTLNN